MAPGPPEMAFMAIIIATPGNTQEDTLSLTAQKLMSSDRTASKPLFKECNTGFRSTDLYSKMSIFT